MKLLFKILLFSILVTAVQSSFGQLPVSVSDSTHIVRKNDKSVGDSRQRKQNQVKKLKKKKGQNDVTDGQSGNDTDQDNSDPVKKINSARPDMTRVRGARPPDITRPSGSLIPRGIGRPGGVPRPGGH
jgi:hypothetical protein